MLYAAAVAQKFALYLHKNNHLDDFKIKKNHARKLFNESFKKQHKVNIHFGTVFHFGLSLLKRQSDHSVMCYNKTKLTNLLGKEAKIDSSINGKSPVKKKVMVSHNLSFNINKRIEETLVSPEECKLCDVKFENRATFEQHVIKKEHSLATDLSKALKLPNKQSDLLITINDSPNLENLILRKNTPKVFDLKITNVIKQAITILSIQNDHKVEVEFNPTYPVILPPSTSTQMELTVYCKKEGVLYYPVVFTTQTKKQAIELVFHTHDEILDDLHPTEMYRRISKPVFTELIEHIDSGERPKFSGQVKMKLPLKKYNLPGDIAAVLNTGLKSFEGMSKNHQAQLNDLQTLLNVENKERCLTVENYTKILDLLLYIEEHQMQKDIRDYDKEDQVVKKVGDLFELEVPGLAENRPSVIVGDSVCFRENKQSRILFEAFVHKAYESSVLLKFSKRFMDGYVNGKKFYVNFTFNRYPLRVEHQAVEFTKSHKIAQILFPKKISKCRGDEAKITWFNKDIANNPEQQQAVRAILNKSAMPSPYLIFGPPGTGKTMTVVESVKQIHKLTNQNILICTPSNSAANEVTKRLTSIPTTDMFRCVAPSFPYNLIPNEIRKYVNYSDGSYYQPVSIDYAKYRIVITTLTSAARLINNGCPRDHFGYVFIDEAGQATETETLIPIAGILSNENYLGILSGQVVLAGDPRQLGPIIHSTLAKAYGFATSMLERLMDSCESYMKDDSNSYNPNALTKLLKNYRSHNIIINQPNVLFYDNELVTSGDHLINVALNWDVLPNPKFPMIFHNVIGNDQREKTSPSFFNIQEVQVVLDYLDKLIGCRMQGMIIKEEHIGIISPYKKQVEKIRKACQKKKYKDMLIGTVEQVQGQEKLIVIMSTVRSKPELLKVDHKFHLGFLNNPKRFNVAVTRAKALLIIVGNANLLQFDQYWRSLMVYCRENKAMIGEKFDFTKTETDEESLSDAENMSLLTHENPEESASFSRGIN